MKIMMLVSSLLIGGTLTAVVSTPLSHETPGPLVPQTHIRFADHEVPQFEVTAKGEVTIVKPGRAD